MSEGTEEGNINDKITGKRLDMRQRRGRVEGRERSHIIDY